MSFGKSPDKSGSRIGQELGGALFDPGSREVSKTDDIDGLKNILHNLAQWINNTSTQNLQKSYIINDPSDQIKIAKYCYPNKNDANCYDTETQ